ncbi:hypothetical protein KFU94_43400 [Chloroflexi bacterium TSY]|nr:hypothetical protein [Chloroflexi bacterium TSY]
MNTTRMYVRLAEWIQYDIHHNQTLCAIQLDSKEDDWPGIVTIDRHQPTEHTNHIHGSMINNEH